MTLESRLKNLHLLTPPSRGIWTSTGMHAAESVVMRPDGQCVHFDAPLFWYQPSWIRLDCSVADELAAAVAEQDIVVSALYRDLAHSNPASGDEQSTLFAAQPETTEKGTPIFLPRMTPYRAERYGLSASDFDETRVVDIRLSPTRDFSGRFAFSPQQMERWERPAEGTRLAGGGHVAAAPFPADVTSIEQLAVKIDQVRSLAPKSAAFVSIGGLRLDQDLTTAIQSKPDGVIVRMDENEYEGLQLAAFVSRARAILVEKELPNLPLWIVPGPVTPDDVVKLVALGATAVAVDAWCEPLIQQLETIALESIVRGNHETDQTDIETMVSRHLWDDIDRVIGLLSSIEQGSQPDQLLGSFSPKWAKACDVSLLS